MVIASGTSPNIVLLKAGDASIIEDSLEMHLVAWWSDTGTKANTFDAGPDDKDGDPTTFDVSCKRKTAPLTVARVFVGAGAPEATSTPVPTATPAPLPTNGPSITDPAPATPAPTSTLLAEPGPVILDLRVLRFRNWIVPRKLGAACPKTATVLVKAAKTSSKAGKLTKRLAVSRIGLKCAITGSIHLTAKLAHAGALVVKVSGTGLRPLSRRVSKY